MISTSARIVRYVANFEKLSIPHAPIWLTERELSELSYWKDSSRRDHWLAGRWIAKRLVARSSRTEMLREVEILSRGADGLGKAPSVLVRGHASDCRLSISHSQRAILVGLSGSDARIGVDVASDVPQTSGFRSRWFSDHEAKWIDADVPGRLPIVWALKESIFKACGNGSKWDPRAVEVVAMEADRVHGRVHGIDTEPLSMWVRATSHGAATAVWTERATQEVSLCS
ncbi:4'-phosphopantetheinyl transferase superfamily protein [Bremerella sp. JC770]|uniref:4'-phosphopantetheinyl transferase family protein n=1 Tax=Bremerella sp. JC770 TaxID=3232137 RepID=UPI00345A05A8